MTASPERADGPGRRLSKRLFGSQYRLEVAAAALKLGASWSTLDLEDALPAGDELPRSCVNKELNALLDLGLVSRSRDLDGRARYRYSVSDRIPEFWALVRALAVDERPAAMQPGTLHVLPTRGSTS